MTKATTAARPEGQNAIYSYNISSRDIFPLVESAGTGNKYQLIHFVCKGSIQGRRDFFFPRALVVHAKEEEKTSGNENR